MHVSESTKWTIYAALYENRPALPWLPLSSSALCVVSGAGGLVVNHGGWVNAACIVFGLLHGYWMLARYRRHTKQWRAALISAWSVLGPEPPDRDLYA